MKIHPSIASANLLKVADEVSFIDREFKNIHIDIEDGNYVPNITFGKKMLNLICDLSSSYKSVHLMVNQPLEYLDACEQKKVDIVFVHIDHLRYPSVVVNEYLKKGIQVGVALNPNAELPSKFYLDKIKNVLLMMCEPDGFNQMYIEELEDKVDRYVKSGYEVWCDGGISLERSEKLAKIGARHVVLGRAIFESV